MIYTGNKTLSVNLVQPDIVWENVEANLNGLETLLNNHILRADLYILPETFSTGFTMQSDKFAEDESGRVVNWMIDRARMYKAMIIGGIIHRTGDKFFNRLYWVSPEGLEGHYDKRHLFRMGREEKHFSPGMGRVIIHYKGFRILPLICYDIRFPVFSRNRNDYDILLYIANWPASRQHVWNVLLQARAIENQSYVIGVNRTGTDGEGVAHSGGTSVIDFMGRKIAGLEEEPGILYHEFQINELIEFRHKFPAWKDADNFTIRF